MATINLDLEASTTVTQVPNNHDTSIDESMLFRNFEPSDFPPCKIRYFDPSVDFVAILASDNAKTSNSLSWKRQTTDTSTEDEARRLLTEMHITMKEVVESEFYRKITDQLRNDPDIQSNIKRVLGSHSHLVMVIYALGSLELSNISQYQLSIALLLKREFSEWIGEIQVFDPMFSPCDCMVLEELGCNVLSVNEECRRKVKKPTLFYMPCCDYDHIANVLEANWCPSQIKIMVLLTNALNTTFTNSCDLEGRFIYDGEVYFMPYIGYREAIKKFKSNFEIPHQIRRDIFYNFSWTFFNVEPEFHMETLFSDDFKKERLRKRRKDDKLCARDYSDDYKHLRNMRERFFLETFKQKSEDFSVHSVESGKYREMRAPRRHQSLWCTPYTGWIKLNFSGKGHDNKNNTGAGFGGVFRNEFKHRMVVYSGNIVGEQDTTVATVEALRQGLRCLQYMSPVKRLIVEGHDLSVIRWVNYCPEPPQKVREALHEIFGVLENVEVVVVYHVYEEANSLAIELANKGAKFHNLRVWIAPS